MNNINHYHLNISTKIITLELGAPIELRNKWIQKAYNLNSYSYKTNLHSQRSSYHVWAETKAYDRLIDNIQIIINHIYKDTKPQNKHYKIDQAWSAVYKEDEYAQPHDHNPAIISFCYYIKTGKTTTPLIFDELNWKIEPKEDMLIMFSSKLYHSVPPHKGEDRIVLAGNCFLVDESQLNTPRHYPQELVNID